MIQMMLNAQSRINNLEEIESASDAQDHQLLHLQRDELRSQNKQLFENLKELHPTLLLKAVPADK